MKAKHIFLAVGLTLVMSSSALAQGPITGIELIDHLGEAVKDCDWKARNLTGGPKLRMLLHKRTMDEVLVGLKAGQAVDSSKLEQALNGHSLRRREAKEFTYD